MNKNKIVPALRFPDFSGDWATMSLSDVCDINPTGCELPNKFIYIDLESVTDGVLTPNQPIYLENAPSRAQRLLQNHDIIFQTVRPYQRNNLYFNLQEENNLPYVASTGYAQIRAKQNSKYLYQYLYYDEFIDEVLKHCSGSNYPAINSSDLSKIMVTIPTCLEEQQKIADCLSSLDELITAQTEKIKALKLHKKALLQKLFPSEGKTVPELRFPDFRDSGEWEETTLGKLIEIKGRIGYRGYTVEDIVKKGEGAISLSPSNITRAGTLNFAKATYISWIKYEESPEIILKNGYTVLVKTGSTFGKAAFVDCLPEKATINPQIVVFKPIKINEVFLFLLVSNYSIQKQIKECVVGGAIPTLSQENISKFDIYVPKQKEQKKIADCLSSMDELINAQTEKIKALKLHKKALMQQLFPSYEGVGE